MRRSFVHVVGLVCFLSLPVAACSSASTPDAPQDSGGVPDSTVETDAFGLEAPEETPETTNDGGFSDKLSATSLYKDWATKAIADDALIFRPAYELWSDGLVKRRFIQLPPGGQIDTSDMDNWKFPIGTKFWKEFATTDGKILETRLIERQTETSYRMGAYAWNDAQTEATWTTAGASNVLGTDHDIPDLGKCQGCHNAAPGKINGFQAIQMTKPAGSGADEINIDWLASKGWLSNPPASGATFEVPGDAVAKKALGYIHANCGHCHNPNWEFFALTNQVLRLTTDGLDAVEHTNIYKTTYYQKTMSFKDVTYRMVPGDSAHSCIYVRPTHRGDSVAMPPIASKHVDDTGTAAIQAWIDSLPPAPPPDGGVSDAGDAAAD